MYQILEHWHRLYLSDYRWMCFTWAEFSSTVQVNKTAGALYTPDVPDSVPTLGLFTTAVHHLSHNQTNGVPRTLSQVIQAQSLTHSLKVKY